jgi:cytochrome P450
MPITAGQRVYGVLAAANRDPAHFPQPDRFDVHREFTPKHHIAFGRGIHFCLGAPLARLEATTAIRVLLERMPGFVTGPGFEPVWHDVATHRGLTVLPLRAKP